MLLCLKLACLPRHPANCRPRLVVEAICDGCGAPPPQGPAARSARRDHDLLISQYLSITYLIFILCAREHLCGRRVTPTSQSTWRGAKIVSRAAPIVGDRQEATSAPPAHVAGRALSGLSAAVTGTLGLAMLPLPSGLIIAGSPSCTSDQAFARGSLRVFGPFIAITPVLPRTARRDAPK